MAAKWRVCLLFLCLQGAGIAAGETSELRLAQGALDAGGGPAQAGNWKLSVASLGQPFQTGELASGAYRLIPGVLQPMPAGRPDLPADFNGDRAVDFADFLLFAAGYGKSPGEAGYSARFDLDGDGNVAFQDFLAFARSFGSRG